MVGRVVAALAFCALVASSGASVPTSAPPPTFASPVTGTIEGRVVRNAPARARRTVNRYAGGAAAVHVEQTVPAVAYIVGVVPGATPGPRRATISQHDTTFVPAMAVVPVGGVVVFPNEDPFFHNVFSSSGAQRFDLGRYPQGESKEVTFSEPGIVRVYCEVHEFMRSAVIVTENPFHSVVADDGGFRIQGVPPGRYTLAVFDVDLGEAEQVVTVTDGGTTRIEVELGR